MHEAERARHLLDSLSRYAAEGTFDEFLIVMRPDEVDAGREAFENRTGLNVRIVDETELVPEIAGDEKLSGWSKQQIIKLAGAARLDADFVLTFDADVLCVHPLSKDILLPGGKALIDPSATHRPWWWSASARKLGVGRPGNEETIGVTPVLMSTEICRRALERLATRARNADWYEYLVRPLRQGAPHVYLPRQRYLFRWSEYTLYFLTAREDGLLDRYHVRAGTPERPMHLLSRKSIWHATDLDTMRERLRHPDPDSLFLVVQSNMLLPYDVVREELAAAGLIEPAKGD
ncbi:hypothetical protein H2509_04675 [Stappia sp. F7233]|uniref:Nucleotide-diphospho-sugar transferase n=1 Tax=Stappia albiluteola TaxID=2758565 RepID=A0A839ACN0_9HYPH|nr:hypothetical protein [Stappia albiluteola]